MLPQDRVLANPPSDALIKLFSTVRMVPRWLDLAAFEATCGEVLVKNEAQVMGSLHQWIKALSTSQGELVQVDSHFNKVRSSVMDKALDELGSIIQTTVVIVRNYPYKLGIRSVSSSNPVIKGRCYVAAPNALTNKTYVPGAPGGNDRLLNFMDIRVAGVDPMNIGEYDRNQYAVIREYYSKGLR